MNSWRYEFSVIIPTYARPSELHSCLESLTRLDYPAEQFEVIVVDDGSPEPLDRTVEPFRAGLNLTLLRQTNQGPALARNAGAAAARGRFLAFTDDDCWPAPDWLRRLEARLEQGPDRLVGGRTINRLTSNWYSTTSQTIVDWVYKFYNQDANNPRFFASNNMALAADQFCRIGGFGKSFAKSAAEDRDLCDRWLHHGYHMTYAPEAVILHAHALSLRSFCKQHFSYGRGARKYHQVRARRGSGRLRDDLPFHARLPALLRGRMMELGPGNALVLASLLVLWQVANAAGFFYEALRDWRSAPQAAEGARPTPEPATVAPLP